MEQLQRMHANFSGHLDTLTDEMCEMNTKVGCIARRQARMAGFAPSSKASPDDAADDYEDNVDSSNDDEMSTSH